MKRCVNTKGSLVNDSMIYTQDSRDTQLSNTTVYMFKIAKGLQHYFLHINIGTVSNQVIEKMLIVNIRMPNEKSLLYQDY